MPQPPRVYKTPGIVLRQRRLGDADKIITFYTANHGKLDAVAKGVRRMTSRLAGHVEPLNHGSYLIAHGRNLDIVTQAQTVETFQPLRDDLGRLSRALYAAELLDRATEDRSENFTIFRLMLDTLRSLAEVSDLDLALRYFEMSLLGELGYRPQLETCVVCGTAVEIEGNLWAPGAGGVICPNCRPTDTPVTMLSPQALRVLRVLQHGRFSDVQQLDVPSDLASELERHMHEAVHYALDRDVRSAAFLDTVRRRERAPNGAGPR